MTLYEIARNAAIEAARVGGHLTGLEMFMADAVLLAVLQYVHRFRLQHEKECELNVWYSPIDQNDIHHHGHFSGAQKDCTLCRMAPNARESRTCSCGLAALDALLVSQGAQMTTNEEELMRVPIHPSPTDNLPHASISEPRTIGELKCHVCGKPAYCIARYECMTSYELTCDSCCGHGNEDGWCRPIAEAISEMSRMLIEAEEKDLRETD